MWVEQNGFVARDFRVTPDAVSALIARGVPFALATVESTSAHLQTGVGYDRCRGSLFVRDPSFRSKSEYNLGPLCQAYAASGPRGTAIVPTEKRELLDGIDLPDAALYAQHQELSVALENNNRDAARVVFERMQADAPGHRLTLSARRTLAQYDGNSSDNLEALEALLQLFPGVGHLQIQRLSLLRALGRRKEAVDWLKDVTAKKQTDPALVQEYAGELSIDGRQSDEAMRLLKRARRFRRADANNLNIAANIHWRRGEFERATLLYRFTLCLENKSEQYAHAYFPGLPASWPRAGSIESF